VRSTRARALALSFALLAACRNTAPSERKAPAASSARPYADAKRFETELARWPARWAGVEPPTDCAALLAAADAKLCSEAGAALAGVQKALAEPGRPGVLRAASTLALAAQRAAEKLRRKGLAELMPEAGTQPRRAPPFPSASASPGIARPPHTGPSPAREPIGAAPPASAQRPHALDEHAHGAAENVHSNPTFAAIREYSRLASLALRQIATYLEHGPRGVRAQALTELVRLGQEQPRWSALEALAREALLTERDPELVRGLEKLVARLVAERG
jgi:hypothetical protein